MYSQKRTNRQKPFTGLGTGLLKVMVHAFNLSTPEAEISYEFKASQGYVVKPCLKTNVQSMNRLQARVERCARSAGHCTDHLLPDSKNMC